MKQPIGFLDSGVGGLTVAREALRQLPNESIIYIGDNARCPYGPRPKSEICAFTNQLVDFLVQKNVKMLVIACNTATAVCLDDIRERLDIPVLGVIDPGVRAANKYSKRGRIGILGTEGTIKSEMYQKLLLRKNKDLELYPLVCPGFVPLVESGEYHSPLAKKIVTETLLPLKNKNLDTVILGCTHYPLLNDTIQKAMGQEVRLVDSGEESISDVSTMLDYLGIAESSANPDPATRQYYTTGSVELFKQTAQEWLKQPIEVERITLADLEQIHLKGEEK